MLRTWLYFDIRQEMSTPRLLEVCSTTPTIKDRHELEWKTRTIIKFYGRCRDTYCRWERVWGVYLWTHEVAELLTFEIVLGLSIVDVPLGLLSPARPHQAGFNSTPFCWNVSRSLQEQHPADRLKGMKLAASGSRLGSLKSENLFFTPWKEQSSESLFGRTCDRVHWADHDGILHIKRDWGNMLTGNCAMDRDGSENLQAKRSIRDVHVAL